jgi:protein-L-isoaspartate(D-aspartate) O-methyltransferase
MPLKHACAPRCGTFVMTEQKHASLGDIRLFFAKQLSAASQSDDERLEGVFASVRREDFLPAGPWRIGIDGRWLRTPSADPAFVYQNCLVALDESKSINNGEPFLHAAWLGAARPKAGDLICHIGAGLGYYTAILSQLASPGGHVTAFEIDERLAAGARKNLARYANVDVVDGDATKLALPECDLIYVNAGVAAPPAAWLQSLRPMGRMIFPWRPSETVGLTLLVTRRESGFEVKPLMPSWFIACVGASDNGDSAKTPDLEDARAVRSVWQSAERAPDGTAVASYGDVWLSSSGLPRNICFVPNTGIQTPSF